MNARTVVTGAVAARLALGFADAALQRATAESLTTVFRNSLFHDDADVDPSAWLLVDSLAGNLG